MYIAKSCKLLTLKTKIKKQNKAQDTAEIHRMERFIFTRPKNNSNEAPQQWMKVYKRIKYVVVSIVNLSTFVT